MYQRCIKSLSDTGWFAMGWKVTGQPTVRKQRGKWVVRVDGIDTETGKHRPRQIGSFGSQRAALAAARVPATADKVVSRGTVGWLVRRYVASRTDVSVKAREQYEWACTHIEAGLGAVRLDRLDREDVAGWLDGLAQGGTLSWRSVQICRTVLRAALAEAVEEGLLRRSPAARVAMPREVAKPVKEKEAAAWTDEEVQRFLAATAPHRWAAGFRLCVLYGLRRSELLALRWDDFDEAAATLRIDEGLIAASKAAVWTEAKNARSRRVIPIDRDTVRLLVQRRVAQVAERLAAGPDWDDHDVILSTRTGQPVLPRSFDRALALVIDRTGLPRLTSHGLRHTAATHMVRTAHDVGELRVVADVLGHSPDMLMKVYAHALPESRRAVADRIGERRADPAAG